MQQVSYRPPRRRDAVIGRFYRHQSITQKAFCSWLCPVGTLSELIGDLVTNCLVGNVSFPAGWIFLCAREVFAVEFFSLYCVIDARSGIHYFMLSPYSVVMDVKMLDSFVIWGPRH